MPLPLTEADRAAGYWWEVSMRQVEVSRTLVFDAPRHARAFFVALLVDNLDLGRPEEMQVVFARRARLDPVGGPTTPSTFATWASSRQGCAEEDPTKDLCFV